MIQSLICKRDGIGGPIGLFMGIFNSFEPLLPLSPRNLSLGLGIPFFIGIGFVQHNTDDSVGWKNVLRGERDFNALRLEINASL